MLSRLILLALMVPGLLLALPVSAAQAQEEKAPLVRHFEGEKGEVAASEIVAAMREGRAIDIDNARITGKLELRGKWGEERLPIAADVRISDSQFEEGVTLQVVDFKHDVNFSGDTFKSAADFGYATFQGVADFSWATFQGVADFSWAAFHDRDDFSWATFQGGAFFSGVTFQWGASFGQATFQKDAFFATATFPRGADYGNATFQGDANFDYASFQGDIGFRYTTFTAAVRLSHALFGRVDVRWDQLKGRLVYDEWDYAALLRNFENLGLYEDADNAYYEYMTLRRDKEHPFYHPQWLLEFVLLDLSCGYGVKPLRAVLMSGVLILLFAAFYYRRGAIMSREPFYYLVRSRWERVKIAAYFSVATFIRLGYGDWYPTGWYRIPAIVEGFLGWLLLALFLVTLGRVWIR